VVDLNDVSIPVARPVIGETGIEAAVRVLRSGRVVRGMRWRVLRRSFRGW
jgi:perosamine synthetase